jgi:hypothetical protein
MGKKIIDARSDEKGNITHVKFEGNLNFTSIIQAIGMADKGLLDNAHAVHPKGKRPYLRSNPDGKSNNNLDDMAEDNS